MSDILIVSLVVVFGPMLCLLYLVRRSVWLADDWRPVSQPERSGDEWRFPRQGVAYPGPAAEVPPLGVADAGSRRGHRAVARPRS